MSASSMSYDYRARAEREAAAIIAAALPNTALETYDTIVRLVAIGWLQGAIYGNHEALARLEGTFEAVRASL